MKNSIKYASLLSVMVLGLSACGGGGDGDNTSAAGEKFKGKWKGGCELTSNNASFKQNWDLSADGSLTNTLPVWLSPGCNGQPGATGTATAKITYLKEADVSTNTCAGNKAQQFSLEYKSLKIGPINETDDAKIRNLLGTYGLPAPKFSLMCIGNDGKLHPGLLDTAHDGSTLAKIPLDVDPNPDHALIKSNN